MSKRFEQAKTYTEKYRDKLLPCRYCGNADIRIASDRETYIVGEDRSVYTARIRSRNAWSVVCSTPNCDCSGIYTNVREAVEEWNERQRSKNAVLINLSA